MNFTELLSTFKTGMATATVATVTTVVDKKTKATTHKVVFTPADFKASIDGLGIVTKELSAKRGEIYQAGVLANLGGVPAPAMPTRDKEGKIITVHASWKPEYFGKFVSVCEKLWTADGKTGLEAGQAKKKAHTNATGLMRAWKKLAGIEEKVAQSPAEKAARKLLKAIQAGKHVDMVALNALVEATK